MQSYDGLCCTLAVQTNEAKRRHSQQANTQRIIRSNEEYTWVNCFSYQVGTVNIGSEICVCTLFDGQSYEWRLYMIF